MVHILNRLAAYDLNYVDRQMSYSLLFVKPKLNYVLSVICCYRILVKDKQNKKL